MYFPEDACMGTELRSLFKSQGNLPPQQSSSPASTSSAIPSGSRSENLLYRAEKLCNELRPVKSIRCRRKNYNEP